MAIQRNDGRYLGPEQLWQPTPCWHPLFSAQPDADGLRIELGPALMNGIIAMQGAPLMMTLRLDGQEDRGVVRVRGTLIGSDAAAPDTQAAEQDLSIDGLPPAPPSGSDDAHHAGPLSLDADWQAASGVEAGVRRPWRLLLGVTLVLLLLAIAAGAFFVLFPFEPTDGPRGDPSAPAATFAPSPESALTGLQFVVGFLSDQPSAADMLAEAEARSEAGDCDAALLLYARAAEADPALGLPVARLFDAATYTEGGCIDAASEETALEYYRSAAEAGKPEAMRRAGEILMSREASGALHDEGAEWLRRADAMDSEGRAEDAEGRD